MVNPFADSDIAAPQQQQQQFQHPNQDSSGGVDFGFNNNAAPDQKLGTNPFASDVNWGQPAQQQPKPQQQNMDFNFPAVQNQVPQAQMQQEQNVGNLFDLGSPAQPAPQQQNNADFFGLQPAQQQPAAGGIDDIMAGFDANQVGANKERSAFEDNDGDGDLSSDVDGDAPQFDQKIGGLQQPQSSGIHSFRGVEIGAMSLRQNAQQQEEQKQQNLQQQPSLAPIQEAADKDVGGQGVLQQQPQQAQPQQQQQNQRKLPQDIIDAQEAFPDMDLEVLKELYLQARKNKEMLFEMCFQMANPDAAHENPAPLQQYQEESDSEDNQAAMIAQMAGMQPNVNQEAMTDQEIADMRMAQQLQDRYVQRAQRESQNQRGGNNQRRQQERQLQEQQAALQQYQNQRNNPQQNPVPQRAGQQQSRLRPAVPEGSEVSEHEFREVPLSQDTDEQHQFRKKKDIKKKQKEEQPKKGFFGSLFGCCASKQSGARPPNLEVKRPELKKKPVAEKRQAPQSSAQQSMQSHQQRAAQNEDNGEEISL